MTDLKNDYIWHHPGLKNRSFAIFSFGKMFHITGWKVGYILAPEELTNAFISVHQYMCFSVNTPAQYALAKHLENFLQEYPNTKMAYIICRTPKEYIIGANNNIKVLPWQKLHDIFNNNL